MSNNSQCQENSFAIINGLAHELKLPMATILSSANLIKKRLEMHIKEEDRVYFELIDKSCNQVLRYAEHSISSLMFANDKKDIPFISENICDFLGGLCDGLEHYMKMNSVSFVVNIPSTPIVLPFNREYLSRAVLNLLSNSMKYTKEHNEIVFTLKENDNYVIIEVMDKGIGIREEHLEKIFDPYYTVNYGSRTSAGNGLGLFIVKSIATIHNGTVEVESEYGKGTKMTFGFPKNLKESNELFIGSRIPNGKYEYSKDLKMLIDVELSSII